jgi:hypothetical protein
VVYTYAIIHKESGIVTSRFRTKEEAERALRSLPSSTRKTLKIVPIDDPKVQEYYRKVNEVRKRNGLPPIDPRSLCLREGGSKG